MSFYVTYKGKCVQLIGSSFGGKGEVKGRK